MRVEWPTLILIVACYALWACAVLALPTLWLPLAITVAALTIALQSSLQHEVLHGHPFQTRKLGELLVFGSLNIAIPYLRFRETHLAHHQDTNLTDPYNSMGPASEAPCETGNVIPIA